jgi:hypothetical protein
MEARINFFIIVCLAVLASTGLGQEGVTLTETDSAGDANVADIPAFPYVAQITGDNVYIRSGPGTNHYPCGKLNKDDKVTVVGSHFGWSRIVPPPGSFSWISARYLKIAPDNPTTGIVTGNAVSVYVGADDREPIRSDRIQLKLDRGENVNLMGERKGDYYKIAPPSGGYLWVSTRYTKPVGPVGGPPKRITPPPGTGPVVPTASVEAAKLEEFQALQKQMEAERAKPIEQQNYASIKKALQEIAANEQAGKAARYSEFAIGQIHRFELASEVAKTVKLQDAQLQKIRNDIARAKATRLMELEDLGRFAAIGQFQISSVYVEQTYQITDDSGKIICYALPTGPASKGDFGKFVGRKVGLVGTIEPHLQTGGALVRFTQVVELR